MNDPLSPWPAAAHERPTTAPSRTRCRGATSAAGRERSLMLLACAAGRTPAARPRGEIGAGRPAVTAHRGSHQRRTASVIGLTDWASAARARPVLFIDSTTMMPDAPGGGQTQAGARQLQALVSPCMTDPLSPWAAAAHGRPTTALALADVVEERRARLSASAHRCRSHARQVGRLQHAPEASSEFAGQRPLLIRSWDQRRTAPVSGLTDWASAAGARPALLIDPATMMPDAPLGG